MVRMLVLLLALGANSAEAGPRWKEVVSSELVQRDGDKFKSERFQVCKVGKDSAQMRIYFEFPADGSVSRDFAISFTSMIEGVMFAAMAAERKGGSEGPMCNPVKAPIGKVDLDLRFYMTGEGVQFEAVDTKKEKTTRSTTRWAEYFDKH